MMADPNSPTTVKSPAHIEGRYTDESRTGTSGTEETPQASIGASESPVPYKVYKRRWFGLVQLVLLNIMESWAVRIECWFLGER